MLLDPGQLLGRGIAFPPRVGPDGRIAWSAGEDNIRDAIREVAEAGQAAERRQAA